MATIAMAEMTSEQRRRIQSAAANLREARSEQAGFAKLGLMNGLKWVPTIAQLKQAENEFWRACHALLVHEDTGPRR
jgi:hypothetical protein